MNYLKLITQAAFPEKEFIPSKNKSFKDQASLNEWSNNVVILNHLVKFLQGEDVIVRLETTYILEKKDNTEISDAEVLDAYLQVIEHNNSAFRDYLLSEYNYSWKPPYTDVTKAQLWVEANRSRSKKS